MTEAKERKEETARPDEGGEAREESGPQFDCRSCPVARIFGLCEQLGYLLTGLDSGEFHSHMSNARRELLLGVKSLVDEAIRLEEERLERRSKAAGKSRKKGGEKLRHISIE